MAKHYMRHPDNFFAGTRMLTLEQRGAYNDLIDIYVARDGDLPDDDHQRASDLACDVRVYRRIKTELVSAGKLEVAGGLLIPNGARATLAACMEKSSAAKKSAEARWRKRGIDPLTADLSSTSAVSTANLCDSNLESDEPSDGKTTQPAMRTHEKRIANLNLNQKEREEGADAPRRYAFQGKVIRLKSDDLERWRKAYHNIPNIEGELTSYDDYLVDEGLSNGDKWFHRTSAWLRNKDAEHTRKPSSGQPVAAI